MPDYRRRRVPGGCYFFTLNLLDRRSSLLTDHIDALRDAIAHVRAAHPFHIDAMSVMPDHLHAVITLPVGDADFSTRWSLVKARFSRSIPAGESISRSRDRKRERGIWQRRFWEHAIADDDDYIHHIDYTHYNPVKHGHVTRPIDWPYSTFHQYVAQGILDPHWATNELPKDFDWG